MSRKSDPEVVQMAIRHAEEASKKSGGQIFTDTLASVFSGGKSDKPAGLTEQQEKLYWQTREDVRKGRYE